MSPRAAGAIATVLLVAVLAGGPAMAGAIATKEDCARAGTPAAEVACLRQALDASEARNARHSNRGERRAAPPAAAPALAAADQVGAEQVPARRRAAHREARVAPARPAVAAKVVAVASDPGGATLRLDNGQVWRVADAADAALGLERADGRSVEIRPSGFGGYRMSLGGLRREIAVRRLQ